MARKSGDWDYLSREEYEAGHAYLAKIPSEFANSDVYWDNYCYDGNSGRCPTIDNRRAGEKDGYSFGCGSNNSNCGHCWHEALTWWNRHINEENVCFWKIEG